MEKLKVIEIMEEKDFVFEKKDIIHTQQIMDARTGAFGLRIFYLE